MNWYQSVKTLISLVGFPISEKIFADKNDADVEQYQTFIGGELYFGREHGIFDFFRYTLFGIHEIIRIVEEGVNTIVYPLNDPYFLASDTTLTQEFRNNYLVQYNLPEKTTDTLQVDLKNLAKNQYDCSIISNVNPDILVVALL